MPAGGHRARVVLGLLAAALAVTDRADETPPAERAPAVAPEAFPLRRATEALGSPERPAPDDPCRALPRDAKGPCFPAEVERQALTLEQKLARFFDDFDGRHGAAPHAPPTVDELWKEVRPPLSTSVNFLALASLLLKARRDDRPPRYFLYVAREDGRAWAALREGRLPAEIALRPGGARYQELGGFPDRKAAQAAYERLEDELALERLLRR